jgi:hypothetical protein
MIRTPASMHRLVGESGEPTRLFLPACAHLALLLTSVLVLAAALRQAVGQTAPIRNRKRTSRSTAHDR